MLRFLAATVTLGALLLPAVQAHAVCGDPPDLLIVLDRSASMSEGTKWTDAKTAINNVLTSFAGTIRFGLLLFPTKNGLCQVNAIQVGCADNTQAAIMSWLNATAPSGSTSPIALALAVADSYLKSIDPGKAKYVVIITDGQDNCSAAGVAASQCTKLLSDGIKTYVVGFGTGVNATVLNDMAVAGGTALSGSTKYYEATNYSQLNSALSTIAASLTCCGNGVLDPGEKCDTGITSGAGKCPTSCNDGVACTTDTLTGSGCNASCTYTPITLPKNGDGCCPPGANSLTDSDCPAVCGNALVELGETCDTAITSGAGKCPTLADCNDGNVCTADSLSGSGCTAKCVNTPLWPSLAAKDGCCPAGASSLTDADCPVVCGNGLLESGELCDTGIASGPGKCPTLADCNDGKPCTVDSVTGTACTLACSHTPATPSLATKDGCCPAGATSLTDADCMPICGNGVVEAGETCDTAIGSGSGKCPTVADCNDGNVCTADILSGGGCTLKCAHTALGPNLAVKDGCCPAGATSATDLDCLPACGNGLLDSGETCDPKILSGTGKCPALADCNDGNVCTTDSLSGSACTLNCAHAALGPNLVAKDGCCPAGATSLTDLDCVAACGNGILESGETCDTKITSGLGACPTLASCNDNNPCTADTLAGSGCTIKCAHTARTASLASKDGCCPIGATALTDADCAAGCGNGVLEPGEICDPKITSGPGTCPTVASCGDGDPCTTDLVAGSGCGLVCSHGQVLANPNVADGCCPKGATPVTDKDCQAVCGNGVVEAGETCDTKITSGPGVCDTAAACDDNDKCTVDALEGSGCTVKCTHKQPPPSGETKDGCCPKGNTSKTDADCLPPCDADKTTNCVDLCEGVTCQLGEFCQSGKCTPFPDGGPVSSPDGGGPQRDGGWNAVGPSGCNCRTAALAPAELPLPLLLFAVGAFLLARRFRRRPGSTPRCG